MQKRVILKIYGLIQGVFFRDFVRTKAKEFGITGWVKNESDGTVVIIAEGEYQNLEKLIEMCYKGPPLAKVKKIQISWESPTKEFKDFEIVY